MTTSGPPKPHAEVEGGWLLTGADVDGAPVRLAFGETELAQAYLGLSIGRDPALNDRTLADAAVSHRHCRLGLGNDGLFIEDLNSLNGTWVDGVELTPFAPEPLAAGQQVTLGRVTLTVQILEG
jgi:FOG: FHA domain